MQRAQPRQRATEACRGRRVLVVIEGAEEADGQASRADLPARLSVLSPEGRTLVLTRSSAQVLPAQTVSLVQAGMGDGAREALKRLVQQGLMRREASLSARCPAHGARSRRRRGCRRA
ncbi:hypothetical protein [Sphaerotilus sp.]|uniref:hypothetical protein n=1 Tax=Sphaerotilus sp. TaxID=2093942 RepID=UPI002ACD5E7B|nr:hypothetical protein [Sphaerotilus sp.]MDZ7859043.1 hypothetical protein [Sphaerotilus sp.]